MVLIYMIKKDLYFKKANIIFRNGILNKEIEPFNDDFYNDCIDIILDIDINAKEMRVLNISGLFD